MLALAAAGILLLAAPDDEARKKLRVAYASLYEWREDKIGNATLDFACNFVRQGRKPEDLRKWKAQGTVVIVDGEIKRIHIEGANRGRADEIRREIDWVLARFVREPFEERFEEAKFAGPEERSGDRLAVSMGRTTWLIANDRLVGVERDIGKPEEPFRILVEYAPEAVGGGYAILGESSSWKRGTNAYEESRTLSVAQHERIPVPEKYVHVVKQGGHTRTTAMVFSEPRLNREHPIVLQPELRDRVKAAWEQRYRIPRDIRIDGEWERDVGKATVRGGWQRRAFGLFQYLRGELEVLVSEKLRVNSGTRDAFKRWGRAHIGEALDLVLERPFEKEFENCGFRLDAEEPSVVHLLGHPAMLAVRIEDGIITAHSEDAFGGVGWWEYRTKKARDGRVLLDRMMRRIDGKRWYVNYDYAREGDFYVPRSFEVIVPAHPWRNDRDSTEVAVLEYDFRKLDVVPPKGE